MAEDLFAPVRGNESTDLFASVRNSDSGDGETEDLFAAIRASSEENIPKDKAGTAVERALADPLSHLAETYGGMAEVAARETTGAAGMVAGGLSAVSTLLTGGTVEEAVANLDSVASSMTYEPSSEKGKQLGDMVDAPFVWADEQLTEIGGQITDKVTQEYGQEAGAIAGTLFKTASVAAGMAAGGVAGAKVGKKAAAIDAKRTLKRFENQVAKYQSRYKIGTGEAWRRAAMDVGLDGGRMPLAVQRSGYVPKTKIGLGEWKPSELKLREDARRVPTDAPESIALGRKLSLAVKDALYKTDEYFGSPVVGASQVLNKALVSVKDRIYKLSPTVGALIDRHESDLHIKTAEAQEYIKPFIDEHKKLSKRHQEDLMTALMSTTKDKRIWEANVDRALDGARNAEAIKREIINVRNKLDELAEEIQANRKNFNKTPNYWPRLLKADSTKVINKRNERDAAIIEKRIAKKEKEKGGKLTPRETTNAVNAVLMERHGGAGVDMRTPGQLKRRFEEELGDVNDYHNTAEALNTYMIEVINDIQKRKLFGKDVTDLDKAIRYDPDMRADPNSLGAVLAKEWEEGRINRTDLGEVEHLLRVRFGRGEEHSSRGVQRARNLFYMSTLGNFRNAVTQLGDIAISAHVNGLFPTIQGLGQAITGRSIAGPTKLGVTKVIQELETATGTSRMLDRVFKVSLFQAVDRLGKQVSINAAYNKARAMSKKDPAKFRNKWGKMFSEREMVQLMDDLANGRDTHLTKSVQFVELARMQPITRSEMPEYYLNHPNGRIFYMLKTFTIKQLGLARKEFVKMATRGPIKQRVEGFAGLTSWAMALTLAGVSTDLIKKWLWEGEIPEDEMSDLWVSNMLKLVGLSRYTIDRVGADPTTSLIEAWLLPPVGVVDDARYIFSTDSEDWMKAARVLPFGKDFYKLHQTYFK